MKNLMTVLLLCAGALMLAACMEDDSYSSDYYSSNGAVASYQSNVTSGYNRDYQPNKGYYSSQSHAPVGGGNAKAGNSSSSGYSSGK